MNMQALLPRFVLVSLVGVLGCAGPADVRPNAGAFTDCGGDAWFLLRQDELVTEDLLADRSRRLHDLAADRAAGPWQEVTMGGELTVDVTAEEGVEGEALLGLFTEPAGVDPPACVRAVPGSGVYTLDGLPPGSWHVGAVAKDAVGVPATWPLPLRVSSSAPARVRLRLWSARWSRAAQPGRTRDVADDRRGTQVIHGCVLGPDGAALPYALVQIRGVAGLGQFADIRTGSDGTYRVPWEGTIYRVGAVWEEPMPGYLGKRHQYVREETHDVDARVDLRVPPFPTGSATLHGRAVDERGRPLERFVVDLRNEVEDWHGPRVHRFAYRWLVARPDGRFHLSGLPAGTYRLAVLPFAADRTRFASFAEGEVTLDAASDGVSTVVLPDAERRRTWYGRVLFEDGCAAYLETPPWPEAGVSVAVYVRGEPTGIVAPIDRNGYFVLSLPESALQALQAGDGELRLWVPIDEPRTVRRAGTFPVDRLASCRAEAGVVRIARSAETDQ